MLGYTSKMEGNAPMGTMRTSRKFAPILFLLWLLLINVFYYAQFKELAITRLPWLARLWH